mmetsp:Transcript_45445/g.83140  ORF Transcript_45445/g.83140 Transcript_45445/m.83140 type:complete len:572 (+) Transcript_45445:52-1767(+)
MGAASCRPCCRDDNERLVETISKPTLPPTPSGTTEHFPTYALPMSIFLQLSCMQTHESIFSQLVRPSAVKMGYEDLIHLISHEWLSFRHPDPDGVQLRLMQVIFGKFIAGEAEKLFKEEEWEAFLHGHSTGVAPRSLRTIESTMIDRCELQGSQLPDVVKLGCVWLDYHSIPQEAKEETFAQAVATIPHYVERCNLFWVCTPRTLHKELQEPRNFYTWRNRGWCRLEESMNLLSRYLKMPLVVTTENNITTTGIFDSFTYFLGHPERAIGQGNFTCCRFNHKITGPDGTIQEIPCDKLALAPVLLDRVKSFYHNRRGQAEGMKQTVMRVISEDFFSGMPPEFQWTPPEFKSAEDYIAAYLPEVEMLGMTEAFLLAFEAPFACLKEFATKYPEKMLELTQYNQTTLQGAVHRSPAEFKQLLDILPEEKRVETINTLSCSGITPLDRAARLGFDANLRMLLEARADLEPRRAADKGTPLLSAANEGYPKCCEILLEFRADVHAVNHKNQTALHLAAEPIETVGNCDLNARVDVLTILLAARADPSRVDDRGHTALDIAQHGGFVEALQALQAS